MSTMNVCVVASFVIFAAACSSEPESSVTSVAQPGPAAQTESMEQHDHALSGGPIAAPTAEDHSGHAHSQLAAGTSVAASTPVANPSSLPAAERKAQSVLLKKKAAGNLADTITDPNQFENPEVRDTYEKAKLVADRLDKMYCYCRCKENEQLAHNSLLTCFQDDHAAHCGICLREAQQAWLDWNDELPIEVTVKAVDLMYNQGRPAPSMP